jgi:hypothetical protein
VVPGSGHRQKPTLADALGAVGMRQDVFGAVCLVAMAS